MKSLARDVQSYEELYRSEVLKNKDLEKRMKIMSDLNKRMWEELQETSKALHDIEYATKGILGHDRS